MRDGRLERAWFDEPDELVDELRRCRETDVPAPRVAGYTDLVFWQRGGQGSVFLASRERDARRVALKVFREDPFSSPVVRRRIEREVDLVSRLRHPGIVRLYHWGNTLDGRPFLAMEFVEGVGLDEALADVEQEGVLELFVEISDALDYAHRHGVIHRDLKPGNLRVDSEGHARLLDFGLAASVDVEGLEESCADQASGLTATGDFIGTLAWASPEQIAGEQADVDTRTDIYSLGALLYRALTGRHPYPVDGGVAQVAQNIAARTPAPPSRWNPAISKDLDVVVLRCLAKEPERRYSTAEELARDLEHVLDAEPIDARRDGLSYVLGSLVRRHPVAVTASVLAFVALTVFAIVTTVLYRRATDLDERARVALDEKRAEAERFELVNEYLLGAFLGAFLGGGSSPEEQKEIRLEDAIDRAALGIVSDESLADRPRVRGDLHTAIAFWYGSFPDRFDAAEEHAREALSAYEEHDPVDRAAVAIAVEALSGVAFRTGRFDEARRQATRALQLYRETTGDPLSLARVQSLIVSCAFATGDLDGIEPLLRECLGILTSQFGPEDSRTASAQVALDELLRRRES